MKQRSILIWAGLVCACMAFAQETAPQNEAYLQYIAKYRKLAEEQEKLHKIPACITLAQGLLESGAGNSELAVKAKNHFGIKCHKDWEGATYSHDDETKDECFRKYTKVADSYEDHSKFLLRPRYASLFELEITDYKGWAHGLRRCGYATDPTYAAKLIHLIEDYGLAPVAPEEVEGKPLPPSPEGEELSDQSENSSPKLGWKSQSSFGSEKGRPAGSQADRDVPAGGRSVSSAPSNQSDASDKSDKKAAERSLKQEQREAQRKAEQEKRKAERAEEESENQAESQQSDLVAKSLSKGPKVSGSMGTVSLFAQHAVHSDKLVRWVIAEPGDTYEEIGYEFNIEPSRILRYNNVSKGAKPQPGDKVYLTRHK